MRSLKIYTKLFIFVLSATIVAGCVAPLPPRPNSDFAYYPKARRGITTIEAAKSDLALMLKNTDIDVIRDKKQKQRKLPNRDELDQLMAEYQRSGGKSVIKTMFRSAEYEILNVDFSIKAFPVSDNKIEVLLEPPLFYRDLLNDKLVVNVVDGEFGGDEYNYAINFANRYSFHFHPKDLASAQRFADDLFVIQEYLKKQEKEQLATFEQQATRYREQAVKPAVSEEQRKLIVQANALSQQKMYDDALDFYKQALAIDLVSYPGAYFNMALLSAQQNRFQEAIGYMKKYLLLEPNASDARSAQDKIYEWELLVSKQG